MLTMVQAIASQTLRSVTDREAVYAFERRLMALSAAHDALHQMSWTQADLQAVAATVIDAIGFSDRVDMSGPAVALGPRAALSFSLIVHELLTNACKYGSLTSDGGHVSLSWDVEVGQDELVGVGLDALGRVQALGQGQAGRDVGVGLEDDQTAASASGGLDGVAEQARGETLAAVGGQDGQVHPAHVLVALADFRPELDGPYGLALVVPGHPLVHEGVGGDAQEAVDFISGMTDRFALQLFHEVFVPSPWQWGRPLES